MTIRKEYISISGEGYKKRDVYFLEYLLALNHDGAGLATLYFFNRKVVMCMIL